MLLVFSTCADFLRTVPVMQHDSDRPEDVDTDGEDHVGDEARYACMSRPYSRRPPPVVKQPHKGLADMTLNDMLRRQEQLRESGRI